jgi:beta-aspartyl-peptidase (threonine type)
MKMALPFPAQRSSVLRAVSLLVILAGAQMPPGMSQTARPSKVDTEKISAIRAVLDKQVEAWNTGHLESFMEGYWKSPDLSFFSAGRKVLGWDATLDRYRKTYQAEGREMGKLAFSELDIQLLGPEAAVVRGRWELVLKDGTRPGGLYTLIFRRFREGWKVIHDHTSSNQ